VIVYFVLYLALTFNMINSHVRHVPNNEKMIMITCWVFYFGAVTFTSVHGTVLWVVYVTEQLVISIKLELSSKRKHCLLPSYSVI